MVVWKMIERLKGGGTVGVVRNAIVGSGIKMLQGMKSSLVVLGTGGIRVGGEEGEGGGNVGTRVCCNPVDGAYYTLIDFGATFEVGIVGVRWRD